MKIPGPGTYDVPSSIDYGVKKCVVDSKYISGGSLKFTPKSHSTI